MAEVGWTAAQRREGLGVALVLLAVVLVLFGPFLFGAPGRIASSPIGDTTHYFVFVRGLYAEELLAGNLPLWNPYIFSGVPFLGAFQTAVLYPPNLIYLVLPLDLAVNTDLALHVAVLGASTYAWLRGRGITVAGACLAAAMVALGGPGFLRVLAGQLTVLGTVSWVPLLLLCIDRLAERPRAGWTLAGVGVTALILLAGHPPTAYMAGIVTALYCIPILVQSRQRLPLAAHLGVVAVGGFGLAAAQWVTGLVEGRETVRSIGMTWEFATSFSLPPENLLTFLVPESFGDAEQFKRSYFGRWFYWDASAYVGVVGLLLALHGVVAGSGRLRAVSLVLAPLLVVLALGEYTPLYAVLYHGLPGFDQIRAPSKLMFFAALFLAALAGEGVSRLQSSSSRMGVSLSVGVVLVVALLLLAAGVGLDETPSGGRLVGWLASLNDERVHTGRMLEDWRSTMVHGAIVSAAVLALSLTAMAVASSRRRGAVVVLVALACLELLFFAWSNRGGTRVYAEYLRRPRLSEALGEAGTDRVLSTDVTSDLSLRERGYATWGNESVVLLRYAELVAATQGKSAVDLDNILGSAPTDHHRLLGIVRTRYQVDREGRVKEHADRMPRFVLLRAHRVVDGPDASLAVLLDGEVDWRTTVVIEEEPVPPPLQQPGSPPGAAVTLLDESTDHMTLEVQTPEPAILLITDAYAKGWRVRGLGESAGTHYRLVPADHALRAVPLASGRHHLRIEYAPAAWRIGLAVSGGTAVLYAAALVTTWRRRRAGAGGSDARAA